MSIIRVAERAGVAVSTVSRFINGSSYVADETAERIRACMRDLGYSPRALRPGPKRAVRRRIHSGSIMFLSLYPDSPLQMYRLPAFPALLGGVQEGLIAEGLNLLLAHCPDGVTVPPALAANKVDGVVLVGRVHPKRGGRIGSRLRERLARYPVVWIFRDHDDPEHTVDHVLYDNHAVGRLAAEYFAQRGHRCVALVNAVPDHLAYIERREQFLAYAAVHGLAATLCEPATSRRDAAATLFVEQAITGLREAADPVTGVFCVADDLLLAAYHTQRCAPFGIGRPLELLGCNNDAAVMSQMRPRPATIDIQLEQIGRKATELLCQRLGESEHLGHVEILLKPVLVAGEDEMIRLSSNTP